MNSQSGECAKCWQCWDWADDELADDHSVDNVCDALGKDHDWDDDEARCLTNDKSPFPSNTPVDCRACWDAQWTRSAISTIAIK